MRYNFLNKNIILALSLLIFLTFAVLSIRTPIMADEVIFVVSHEINNPSIPKLLGSAWSSPHPHPHLYDILLAVFFKFLGRGAVSARLVGILCFLATLALTYYLVKEIFKDRENNRLIGALACLLFAINPLAIQGAILLDIENTILTTLLTLFIFCFVRFYKSSTAKRLILLGAVFGITLWAKLTTPLVFILIIPAFYALEGQFKRGILYTFVISVIGLGLFSSSWWLYCRIYNIPFLMPFRTTIGEFLGLQSVGGLSDVLTYWAKRSMDVTLWISPFLLLLGIVAVGRRIKRLWLEKKASFVDLLVMYVLLIFVVYIFTGGTRFGIPRHHFAMLPILSIIVVALIFELVPDIKKKQLLFFGGIMLLLIGYNIAFVGDLIYNSRIPFKEALIENSSVKPALMGLAFRFLLYLLPLIAIFPIAKLSTNRNNYLRTTILYMLTMIIAASLSLDILQARAEYQTLYCYGEKGVMEVVNFLDKKVPPDKTIVAPHGITYNYNLRNHNSPHTTKDIWNDKESLKNLISNQRTGAVVYGVSSNTVYQFREIFRDESIHTFLQAHFVKEEIGSYTVWLRN